MNTGDGLNLDNPFLMTSPVAIVTGVTGQMELICRSIYLTSTIV